MNNQWNSDVITPEGEAGSTPIATNGGLDVNTSGELEVKVDGSTIDINSSGELEAIGGGAVYEAGEGIVINGSTISADETVLATKAELGNYATTESVTAGLSAKQDTISDLDTIRAGAQAGASAVQPSGLAPYATTASMNTALAGKQDVISDLSTIRSGAEAGATALQPGALDDYVTDSDLSTALSSKQDTISDLGTIRAGASAGATAVQPGSLATVATTGSYNDLSDKPTIPPGVVVDQTYDGTSANAQSGIAVAGALVTKQDVISDLSTIRSGAAAGATAVQPSSLATVATTGDYDDLANKPTIPVVPSTKPVVAGSNITITDGANNVTIAATDTTYTAGTGLTLSSGAFSVDTSVVATQADVSAIRQVPSASAADQNKVLGVTDAQGTVGWMQGGGGVDVHVISCENLNPLGLPPKTIRMRFVDTTYNPSTSLSTSDYSFSLVDASTNTWDITLNDNKPYIGNDISYDASQGYEVLDLNWYGIGSAANLFLGAQALLSANITSFKTVKSLSNAFNGCSNLTSLTLGHLEDVENIESMCIHCLFTAAPDLSSLRNVESMNGAFNYCENLVSVPDLPLEHMPHVVNVNYMFAYCYNVESGALSLYQKMAQYISGADHYGVFEYCGSNTASGEQDLNQIPASWGGNA